jgi:hypothetical protein
MIKKPEIGPAAATIYMPRDNGFDFGGNAAKERAAHAMMDLNADGKLSKDEWSRTGRTSEMFAAYDADRDGAISEQEYVNGREAERAFARRDRNGDGVLTKDEWSILGIRLPFNPALAAAGMAESVRGFIASCIQPTSGVLRGFEAFDADKNGKVTAAEYVKERVADKPTDFKPWLMKTAL